MSIQDPKQVSDVKVLLKMGQNGVGIQSIAKTGSTGLVDTYTITYDNNQTTTFTVTNGASISSVQKTSTQGNVDTYTITLTNNETFTFTITNGTSIASIEKTSTQGAVDTYTITLTNGDTFDFDVTNGVGTVAGDIGYDNTSSGLSATKVQGALDEIAKPTFTEASSRTNIASSEKLSTIFGKIKKYFTDLKTVAFSGAYSDLTGKPTIDTDFSTTSTNALQNKVVSKNDFSTIVNLSSYSSQSNIYTFTTDGYIYVIAEGDNISANVCGSTSNSYRVLLKPGAHKALGLYVKKGMRVYIDYPEDGSVGFMPLS